jgi:WD40 repeat protein
MKLQSILMTIVVAPILVACQPTPTPIPTIPGLTQDSLTAIPTSTPVFEEGLPVLPEHALDRLGIGVVMDSDLSPADDQVVIATTTGVYLYSIPTLELVWSQRELTPVEFVSWSTSGTRMLSQSADTTVLRESTTGKIVRRLNGLRDEPVWSPTGRLLAARTTSGTNQILLIDGLTGARVSALETGVEPAGQVFRILEWSSDEHYVATALHPAGSIFVWDANTGELIHTLTAPEWEHGEPPVVREIKFSPDNMRLAAVFNEDIPAQVWNIQTGEVDLILDVSQYGSIDWAPDGEKLGIVDVMTGLSIVDAQTGASLFSREFNPDWNGGQYGDWSPDGSRFAVVNYDDITILKEDGTQLSVLPVIPDLINDQVPRIPSFHWLSTGDKALVAAPDLLIWDSTSGTVLNKLSTSVAASRIAWDQTSKFILIQKADGTAVWEVERGSVNNDDASFGEPFESDSLFSTGQNTSPDGKWTAKLQTFATCDFCLGIFSQRGDLHLQVDNAASIHAFAWSPDSVFVAVAVGGLPPILKTDILIIDSITGNVVSTLQGHTMTIRWMAFSPDSTMLISSSKDSTVIIWDVTR